MSSGRFVRAASLSSVVLKCTTLFDWPHFSIFVIFALSSSVNRSLAASSVAMFIMNKPIIGSADLDTGDDAVSAPLAEDPLVAAGVPALSFSFDAGPGRLTTLV